MCLGVDSPVLECQRLNNALHVLNLKQSVCHFTFIDPLLNTKNAIAVRQRAHEGLVLIFAVYKKRIGRNNVKKRNVANAVRC